MSYRENNSRPPHWVPHRRWSGRRTRGEFRAWLLDAGSLTDRMRAACAGCFSVRVLDQGWHRPRLDEAGTLAMQRGVLGWIREVQLLCDGEPWVFARTVIPVTTLKGAQRRLARLGNRPLGAVLFADPGMRRDPVELACIRPGQAMFATATQGLRHRPEGIWGRRSVFRVGGKPLLVTEVFLPAFKAVS
ncbi:MAG: chorismate lyase [Gammaproteobacteria bacterium]